MLKSSVVENLSCILRTLLVRLTACQRKCDLMCDVFFYQKEVLTQSPFESGHLNASNGHLCSAISGCLSLETAAEPVPAFSRASRASEANSSIRIVSCMCFFVC